MICPKCRFDQPDDVYCAYCGIDVEKYLRKKRRKRQRAYFLTALISIATLSVGAYLVSVYRVETPEQALTYDDSNEEVRTTETPPPEAKPDQSASRFIPQARKKDLGAHRQSEERIIRPESVEERGYRAEATTPNDARDRQKAEVPLDRPQKETQTSAEWFEKGVALDDESEAEIEYYKKAIALDPKFVPARYRLGAIYYRRANYALADQHFAEFLKHASEADRQIYDIYIYYSPSDVERLTGGKVPGTAPTEGAEKEVSPEGEAARIETPSEVEGAEEETTLEGEAEGEEAPVEAREKGEAVEEGEGVEGGITLEPEEAEEETHFEGEEEAVEETSEGVLTIIRFLPADGHVIVPVIFNGFLEGRVLVDTGAGITVLSRELAQELQLMEEPGHGVTLKTMAMDVQAGLATLDSIQIGSLTEHRFRVAITDLPGGKERKFDAILGMDLLNKYKIHIDNVKGRIVLSPGRQIDE